VVIVAVIFYREMSLNVICYEYCFSLGLLKCYLSFVSHNTFFSMLYTVQALLGEMIIMNQ